MKRTFTGTLYTVAAITLVTLMAPTLYAGETDNYLAWDKDIKDSSAEYNNHYNNIINKQIERANRSKVRKRSCHSIVKSIGIQVNASVQGDTGNLYRTNKNIDRYPRAEITKKEYHQRSIYRDIFRLSILSPVVNIGGVYLGTDKISHSIGFGFVYYMKYSWDIRHKAKKLGNEKGTVDYFARKMVIDFGVYSELNYIGLGPLASGIFSLADLESNYQGFQFYHSLCNGESPRIQKVEGSWKLVHPLDLKDYVNPNWDETYNPNGYTKNRWKQVRPYLLQYCSKLDDPIVQKRMAFYRKGNKLYRSINDLMLKKMIRDEVILDPYDTSLERICVKDQ